jgi:poly-gamma-glutamate capsule biosynthesis protein CapA/YwtB (metallophosphatase superfamily)
MMAGAKQTVSAADLALCSLSTPLDDKGPFSGAPRYRAPAEVAQALADTGFDGCATASEHSFDQGEAGVAATLRALDAAKVGHSGTYTSQDASEHPKLYNANGVKVAHLAYTIDLPGTKTPAGNQWAVARPTAAKISNDARNARDAGAQIVVVSVDWGTEPEHEPDVDEQLLAHQIASMRNVDIVFGHGAHVVQPIEHIGDKWIVYGLGDFDTRDAQPENNDREGSMMRVTFSPSGEQGRWKVAAIEALPTFIDLNPDIRVVDLERALADPSVPAGRRSIYEAAVDRISSALLSRGGGPLVHVRATGK